MLAPKHTSYDPLEINAEGTIQAVMALLNQKEPMSISRWFCEVCGMIHLGITPLACDSCGHEHLTQQADTHWEMNSRW